MKNAWWDIIVIDECHNVAARAGEAGMSRRARLARMLATRSDTLMLLSATPHDGSARSFASLMSLLDPTAISDPDDYTPEDFRDKGLVIRRFKKDIRDQVQDDFQERITDAACSKPPAPQEEAAYRALLAIPFTQEGEHRAGKQQELQRVGMQKAIFSSPAAALESTHQAHRVCCRQDGMPTADEPAEVDGLQAFAEALERSTPRVSASTSGLMQPAARPRVRLDTADPSDRLVIFSERIETLRWLQATLLGSDLA